MLDLEPATRTLSALIVGVSDDQLAAETPCSETSVGDLIDHIDSFSLAFTEAAINMPPEVSGRGSSPDAARLGSDWRTRIPDRLASLADAWRDETAWAGMTQVGGLDLPGETAGLFALDEVIVHGWDLAVASGQGATYDPALVDAVFALVRSTVAEHPEGSPGLFGPPVPVGEDAPLLDRLLGLTGRDPAWARARTRTTTGS